MQKDLRIPLDLQMFAEQGDADSSSNNTETKTSVEDFLKTVKPEELVANPLLQPAIDSKISKAVDKALQNARAKWESEKTDQLSEAEKLAKMTQAEREKYEFKKQMDMFQKEKSAFERDKLIVAAGKELQLKGIDAGLAKYIVGSNADETNKNLEEFQKLFSSSLEKVVEDRLKGKVPPLKTGQVEGKLSTSDLAGLTPDQINEKWAQVK